MPWQRGADRTSHLPIPDPLTLHIHSVVRESVMKSYGYECTERLMVSPVPTISSDLDVLRSRQHSNQQPASRTSPSQPPVRRQTLVPGSGPGEPLRTQYVDLLIPRLASRSIQWLVAGCWFSCSPGGCWGRSTRARA